MDGFPNLHLPDVADIDAHKTDLALLRRMVREQRAVFENAPVGIAVTQPDQVRSFNPRAGEMFGFAPHEVGSIAPEDVCVSIEDYQNLIGEAFAVLSRGGLFEKTEQQFRRRNGSTFWARLRGCAVEPGNRAAGTIWIVEDVTEARQAMSEVQAIMTNSSIGIMFTRNRVIRRANPAFCQMFGYGEDEPIGISTRSLYPDETAYRQLGADAYPQLARGLPFRTERTLVRRDGTPAWVQMIGYQVNAHDPDKGTIWMLEDRTRERSDEQSLREALMENRAILDNAVLGIAVVEGGRTLHCNRKMEELFGMPPGGMDGIAVRSLYPDPASWKEARELSGRQFALGQAHMAEHEMVRRDGSRFWARLSGRLFDLAQAGGRSVWLVDDVTAQREAADTVLRARDELELRVAARTAELAGANALLQEEINERRQAEARVHHMAYHDSLTGLPNRAMLSERLDAAMRVVSSGDEPHQGQQLALMFIDLDRFKNINDTLGHLVGDGLLRNVALRLVTAVRPGDLVARLGGDEFVVLMPAIADGAEAAAVAGNIISALSMACQIDGHSLHISPSIGICLYPDDGVDVETLMRHADAAMYQAKAAGRNNYQFFTARMNQAAARHFELESNLRGALARDEFALHFQPIMCTESRRPRALEVLLRWRRGATLVGPDEFIPILEESGMIVEVGEWVIRSACAQVMEWQREGLDVVPLAINLSARQFMHQGLVESIRAIVDDTGIDPRLVEFEITETALMQHGGQTLETLRQMNAMGMCLSIDDFGTGYSSLAYLKRFPVRKIKIDRAFVRELEASAEDRAIVAAVMALANSLQLSVVAEGVETEGQYALLRSFGCQYAQGYLFARPLPAEQVAKLLAG
ncbi:sensor domain-containing protein [Telluria beijingensis]|uniref:sensor domain-containing protein n=1 Tax=Telluria beijingensis TaxID=3068633 RepID=UPI00279611BF|nr:EAL domain-containing protein [Massilia sp. REN29]